jgi:hypothetical protein
VRACLARRLRRSARAPARRACSPLIGEALLDLGPPPLGLGGRLDKRVADEALLGVERGELMEDSLLQLLARQPLAAEGLAPVLLAAVLA